MSDQMAKGRKKRRSSPWWAIAALALATALYGLRVDATYLLTAWPAWIWCVPVLLLGWFAAKWRPGIALLTLAFCVAFVDEFAQNRRERRCEAGRIAAELKQRGVSPDLIAGDFNSSVDMGSLGVLCAGKRDAFVTSGRGLGATCVNPYPCIVRIDQIWSGDVLEPKWCEVVGTQNSDHRMVLSAYDFVYRP